METNFHEDINGPNGCQVTSTTTKPSPHKPGHLAPVNAEHHHALPAADVRPSVELSAAWTLELPYYCRPFLQFGPFRPITSNAFCSFNGCQVTSTTTKPSPHKPGHPAPANAEHHRAPPAADVRPQACLSSTGILLPSPLQFGAFPAL